MNELLPFGEFAPRERAPALAPHFLMGLESWELERILHRLNVTNSHSSMAGRARRSRNRSEAVAISDVANTSSGQHRAHAGSSGREQPSSSGAQASPAEGGLGGEPSSNMEQLGEGAFPSSWPPASERSKLPMSPSGHYHQGSFAASRPSLNVDLRAASETIRSRWQAVAGACKSSFGKFTRNRHLQPDLADEPGPSAVNGAAAHGSEPTSSGSLQPASTTSQAEGQGAAAS